MIEGRLVRGLGKAAGFTQLDWVRRRFLDAAGIDPHPGTVNLDVMHEYQSRWTDWCALPGEAIQSEDMNFCSARCYPVRIAGRIPGAIVVPEVPDYPAHKLEFVSALAIRSHLSLDENSSLKIELCQPLGARTVVFDLDGTLVGSVGAYLEVARVAARLYDLEVTEQQVRHALSTGTNFWKSIVTDEAQRKALFTHAAREWPRILREHGKVFPGLAETLDSLKRKGLSLGIVSGARPEVMELLHDVRDRFDVVVLGPDVSQRKPHPEGIQKALQQLGVAPQETIYVGDTPLDIQASRAAGVRAVGVLTGAGDSALLSTHEPERLIASHAKLAGILLS